MRIARFYTAQPLATDRQVVMESGPSHHLLKVLRARPGDPVTLFNGDGDEYQAVLESAEDRLAHLRITGRSTPKCESDLHIVLGQGISRGERMDFVIQKAVELGVNEITPLWTGRAQVQLDAARLQKRMAHWQGVIVAACEQSGRVQLPVLCAATALDSWLSRTSDALRLVLQPGSGRTLHEIEPHNAVELLLGPEGGLDDDELQRARSAGFQPVSIGPRILRTETATLATLAALQTLWGDFGSGR